MVSSPAQANKKRYLVLESRQRKALLPELYKVSEAPRWEFLFADTEWQEYLDESPVLLEATQDSPEYHWALQGLKGETLIGLILESSQGLDAVAVWLRARLTVHLDAQRTGLLRFYDPWIWHRLAPRSMPVPGLIDRAIYWYGQPGQRHWQMIDHPEPIAMSPVPALDESQWLALNDSHSQA